MNLSEFNAEVWLRLPPIADEVDKSTIDNAIRDCFEENWSIEDTISYLTCMEEVSPDLSERVALQRMSAIYRIYHPDVVRGIDKWLA